MRSFFNVDSIVTTRRLMEVRKNYFVLPEYELHAPLPGERPYDAFSSGFNLSTDALEASLRFSLHPVIETCLKGWQMSPSQMAPNSWHYLSGTGWVLLDPRFVHDLVVAIELRVKELEEDANELRAKLESLKSQRRDMEQEVRVLRPSLDEARNDRARLEGDVLSLTEVVTLLKVELKAEGPRAMAAYKASRGFESGVEKMGRVSYEFGYWVALEWLQRKYSKITIE
ncbi:hypothetical protein BHE74_00037802 [Ensete ventricosum]|nr:hypothetical protein BHE74_00037802 [Ensete ventricosum]